MERAELMMLLRATGCAVEKGAVVFLCDPRWSDAERAQARALMEMTMDGGRSAVNGGPLTVDGGNELRGQRSEVRGQKGTVDGRQWTVDGGPGAGAESAEGRVQRSGGGDQTGDGGGWLCVPTGGTSGAIRFARHDERTLSAAIDGFAAHFGLTRVNAVDVLPPFHVSGLMARVRCAATGGTHIAWHWKRIEEGEWPVLEASRDWVISLVPTQLQRLLASTAAVDWLRAFTVIFIGGGPVWPELADAAAAAGLRISLSYGMTETAAMVAAQRPEEFLAGDRSCGRVLPHARIEVAKEGEIGVGGASVFRGYWPLSDATGWFQTPDLGQMDADGRLRILGRGDAVIISGGEKVNPFEVEAVLRAVGEFEDVAVVGLPDLEWGERVVACYPAGQRLPDLNRVERMIGGRLSGPKRPKRYVPIATWPRNEQGKLQRAKLVALLSAL